MRKNSILYLTLALAAVGGSMYFLAIVFSFYWLYWWYDVVMHFLVGLTGGLGLFWGLFDSGLIFRGRPHSKAASVITILICVMVVGVAWEIFEYKNGLTYSVEGYGQDTANDLVLDGCGAFLAALLVTRKKLNV